MWLLKITINILDRVTLNLYNFKWYADSELVIISMWNKHQNVIGSKVNNVPPIICLNGLSIGRFAMPAMSRPRKNIITHTIVLRSQASIPC